MVDVTKAKLSMLLQLASFLLARSLGMREAQMCTTAAESPLCDTDHSLANQVQTAGVGGARGG